MVMAPVALWAETANILAQGRLRCLIGSVLRPWRLRCTVAPTSFAVENPGKGFTFTLQSTFRMLGNASWSGYRLDDVLRSLEATVSWHELSAFWLHSITMSTFL